MDSRLDRLFILLDTGSNESIRLAAAKQLGEVQRVQPNDLDYLLDRIKEYSCKPNWETRTAAGHAIRCVLEKVPSWPDARVKQEQDDYQDDKLRVAEELIKEGIDVMKILREFDLSDIANNFPTLLSTNSMESDDLESSTSVKTSKARGRKSSLPGRKQNREQLQRQRQLINKELGIAMVDSLGVGVKSTDIVTNDDLQVDYTVDNCDPASNGRSASNMIHDRMHYSKILNILHGANCFAETSTSKTTQNVCDIFGANDWPLSNIVRHYEDGLFDASWETRHGSAISLREIVKLQGKCAGKRSDLTKSINDKLNELWLVDMALRAVCVLVLDRFGDFLFDQVIAPVRENGAQLLGCCVTHLPESSASSVIDILVKMLDSPIWETRHGGMLGLKYSLGVLETNVMKKTICRTFDSIFKCLADPNDDVSAEAASTLVLVKDILLETIPDKIPHLIRFLWDHLANLDELTSSTSNIILLLASMLTASSTQLDVNELNKSISKLWPLLNHSSTTVRVSVLKALITLSKLRSEPCLMWMPEAQMTVALRLIFQRSILENMDEVHGYIKEAWLQLTRLGSHHGEIQEARTNLLRCTSQYLNYWLCLAMQPTSTPIDRGYCMWLNIRSDGTVSDTKPDGEIFIGSSTFNVETMDIQRTQITKCRALGTDLLGALYSNLTDDSDCESQQSKETLRYLSDMFVHYLSTKSANQRMISAWALESWASHQVSCGGKEKLNLNLPETVARQLHSTIKETTLCYDELASAFTRIQQEARDLVQALNNANISTSFSTSADRRVIYNLSQIQSLCDLNLEAELTRAASKKQDSTSTIEHQVRDGPVYLALANKKQTLSKSFQTTRASQKALTVSTLSSISCAIIAWNVSFDRVRSLIDPLLDSIETECEVFSQDKSISYLVKLLDVLCSKPEENKEAIQIILNRLIDTIDTCSMALITGDTNSIDPKANSTNASDEHKIILLDNLQRRAEQMRNMSRRQSSVSNTASLKRSHSQTSNIDETDAESWDSTQCSDTKIKMAGTRKALGHIVSHFAGDLPEKLPELWRTIREGLQQRIESFHHTGEGVKSAAAEADIVKDLITLEVVSENLDRSLYGCLSALPDHLIRMLDSPSPSIRHRVSQCMGVIAKIMFNSIEGVIGHKIIPMLDSANITSRCGAMETISLIIERLHLDLVSKMNMFIVHVLRRMGDQNDQVRLMATHCFGKLLSLMPLNLKNGDQKDDSAKLNIEDDSRFIEQLLDPKKLKNHNLQFETRVQLRSYQQEGLNWLAFLNRFNLHGILCDEMGLGKTFMTICMVASEHFTRMMSKNNSDRSPSLIVCPPTLIEHWLYEIEKFVPVKTASALNSVGYRGGTSDRNSVRSQLLGTISNSNTGDHDKDQINLVVTSYDVLRNDIDFFKMIQWNYCVLDEGHIIKNGKTKLSRAIRLLTAKHRLILSGTPIQNNVTELWSLFDFLMPGFLGSERQFNSRYARPILQSSEPKCSSKDLESGALAMESLHRQVLPFILRRLKEDVLDDLPPKILQDYYCELSPLQSKLYEDFTRGKLCNEVTKRSLNQLSEGEDLKLDSKINSKSHVFQALQYLKSVCNHPKLVLSQKHSQYNDIKKYLESEKSSLDDIGHSSKLTALKQLLYDCGIGLNDEAQQKATPGIESVVNQHRALIFCQLKSMVEIIENDLFKRYLPNITYLRLDGSVPTNQRHSIVSRFNNDPSIDVLLLTTHIGGLGLNLTGADTVIFVEHDWNPTRDLQAMDRAHRIGQKKVVNVYRLITKDTLEEKIMGLQKFKTMVSNTVINQDNTGLGSMNVDQLLDLFDSNADNTSTGRRKSESRRSSVTDLLPELWDQQQYETEYDLESFVASLKN